MHPAVVALEVLVPLLSLLLTVQAGTLAWKWRKKRKTQGALPLPVPPPPPEPEPPIRDWEAVGTPSAPSPAKPIPAIPTIDDWDQVQKEWEEELHAHNWRLRDAVEELCGHVTFAVQRILAGYEKSGEKEVGFTTEEIPHPGNDMVVRPLRDFSELPLLLPHEACLPEDIKWMRILSGDALIAAHAESKPIMEDIHSAKYKVVARVLYVLWDCSSSMGGGRHGAANNWKWRVPVWKGVLLRLMEKALRGQVPICIRPFGPDVGPLTRVVTPAQAIAFRRVVLKDYPDMGGTDIGRALEVAIDDFSGFDYDTGDIILLTDGEDEGLDRANQIRHALDGSNLKLHALMLGVENESLRQLCDVYHVVESDLTVHAPVRR